MQAREICTRGKECTTEYAREKDVELKRSKREKVKREDAGEQDEKSERLRGKK